jgi:hypothetical protein
MARLGVLACAFAAAWCVATAAWAADRLVPSQYLTIQAAIDAAAPGDRVLVSSAGPGNSGIYVGQVNMRGKAITLKSTGGAALTTLTVGSASGAIVVCNTNETSASVIDGFTIAGATSGPGVQITSASPFFKFCEIKDNLRSDANGAGVAFTGTGGSPRFEDCFFFGNYASGRDGGGIAASASGGSLTCERCVFRSNQVVNANYGGAVHAVGVATSFKNCMFQQNSVLATDGDRRGGAINTTGPCTLTDCSFVGNWVSTGWSGNGGCYDIAARGGSIYSTSDVTATRVGFDSNYAQCAANGNCCCGTGLARGGAVVLDGTSPSRFEDCTFLLNSARNPMASCSGGRDARGGAVFVTGSAPAFLRCVFTGNRAENCTAVTYGGTLFYETGSEGSMIDCVISGGFANSAGGGVYLRAGAGPNMQRTVFANCSTANGGSGGAMYIEPSSVLTYATECRFTNCTATNGGAVYVGNARPRFDRCVFDSNTAVSGSAIRSVGTGSLNIPTVCYSTFCGNSGSNANWILGAFSDPHPNTPTNIFNSSCGNDCNGNGIVDSIDIAAGLPDCNNDGIPNTCEADCDGDLIPNVCEIAAGADDCDLDGIPDSCEVASGDVNHDGVPDSCQPELEFEGIVTEIVPMTVSGTGLPSGAVCWRVYAKCKSENTTVHAVWGDSSDPLAIAATGGFWQSSTDGAGDLPVGISCSNPAATIIYDSYLTIGAECGDGTPLASTGIDFTGFAAGLVDLTNSSTGGAIYVSANGVPAGSDRKILLMQLTTSTGVKPSGQFNLTGEHSLAGGGAEWNAYGLTIPDPVLVDCNGNGQHDALEIAAGSVTDCDLNGVPDQCQSASAASDCDGDGTSDFCEFEAGAPDVNNNGKPDECDCVGDTNGDGAVNVDDLIDVIVAWGDSVVGGPNVNDQDGLGVVNSEDLVTVLNNWGTCTPPTPPGGG